ncbi:MAG: hypothetical protein KI793_35320 [Rivularia sp. (in: Bacteria)]|nr:hypothetical protein [Rivularia sp. MS3]
MILFAAIYLLSRSDKASENNFAPETNLFSDTSTQPTLSQDLLTKTDIITTGN